MRWPLSDLTVTHALTSSLTEVNVNLFFEAYLKHNLHLNICRADVILKPSSCYHVNFKWPVLHWYGCNNKSNKLLFVLHFSKAGAVQGAIKEENITVRNINLVRSYEGNLNTNLKLKQIQ